MAEATIVGRSHGGALGARSVMLAVLVGAAACQGSGPLSTATLTVDEHSQMYFPISSGPHAVDCNSCHGAFDSFKQFDCTSCHGHEQTPTDLLHGSVTTNPTTKAPQPYAYASSSCYSCHPSGAKIAFDHVGIATGCATCHDVGQLFAALPVPGFTHGPMSAQDCSACHYSTTDWKTGGAPPNLVSDPLAAVTVSALLPSYSGAFITALSPQIETLVMSMNHASTQIDQAAFSACANCHVNADAGSYYPGTLHSSLANLKLAQPTVCSDCHSTAAPTGFVGPTATSPARTPASGEMKHDAVAWMGSTPGPLKIVPKECGLCHTSPSQTSPSTWATSTSGGSPALLHASLTNAQQPTSCIDCHANTAPQTVLTSTNATLPATLVFDHTSPATQTDCVSCHKIGGATQWTAWSGARFHLPGSATPSTCLPCHDGERPTSTTGWTSTTYTRSPFDYVVSGKGITHGDGQDCVSCHAGPGSGAWGTSQDWVGGHFDHAKTSVADSTCIACHSTQRPDLQQGATAAGMATLLGFDHSVNGTGDCFGCHQATVAANTYVSYASPTTMMLPGGDWKGGETYPGSALASGQDQFITINETTLQRSGAYNLVTGSTTISATFYNAMLHISVALPAVLNAGPTGNPDSSKCWHCHTNTNGTVTSYANGQYHSSLTSYAATPGGTVVPFPQPTMQCTDCHTQMHPVGIVEKAGSDLQPMDHNAMFQSAVTIGGVSASGVGTIQCAVCHHSPGVTWSDGKFHANIGAAVPSDCTTCHYPTMADTAKADVTSGVNYKMGHASTQLTFQNCQTCHTGALAKAANTPIASTLFSGGAYHASLAAQPAACLDCHTVSEPAAGAPTQSSWTYALATGGTTTNGAQWMNHGSAYAAGKDCAACHATDAKKSGSAWNKADYFHTVVTNPTTCQACHGLTNGKGSAPGTGNNMPAGLTSSAVVSSAASDATTGVAAGTLDQISHADVNVTGHDCNFCHTQIGISSIVGKAGKEWAQGSFHASFTAANSLVTNQTTGRCSNCHMNVRPGASFTAQDHSTFTNVSGTEDCSSCHSWPGTGTVTTPNWLGAAGGFAPYLSVGGFPITQPPASTPTTQAGITGLPHPTVPSGTACTTCHLTAAGGTPAIGYDHASALINANCGSCHEAGSGLVGTVWNKASTQSAGAGDTRPIGLTALSRTQQATTATLQAHFYPVDCYQCHKAPTGIATVTTGSAYTSAWGFPHTTNSMTNPSTCLMCHVGGVPN